MKLTIKIDETLRLYAAVILYAKKYYFDHWFYLILSNYKRILISVLFIFQAEASVASAEG